MTVKELIAELLKVDGNKEIVLFDEDARPFEIVKVFHGKSEDGVEVDYIDIKREKD